MTPLQIRLSLINAGVKNLKQFGYPDVKPENILIDIIYKEFFLQMLEDNIGKTINGVDVVINELITEIKTN